MATESKSMSETNSVNVSSQDDEIELVRDGNDADSKSDEILLNYGDKVLLDEWSEEGHPSASKPLTERVLAQVRYFVANQTSTAQVSFDISPFSSESTSEDQSDMHSHSFVSKAPFKSYSSLGEYLKDLGEDKSSTGPKCTGPILSKEQTEPIDSNDKCQDEPTTSHIIENL